MRYNTLRAIRYGGDPLIRSGGGLESRGTYNPTAMIDGGRIYLFYRAEGDSSIGSIFLAESPDDINFVKVKREPVLLLEYEYEKYGCEDPRIVRLGSTYVLTYVGNDGKYYSNHLCLATSKDLITWVS
ncbi:MAG: hypothetical protein B6U69_03020 [Thermofilum sp. ex4484_15]|nr:MAG: hypothetical protein B6U69_03020 [Thermofilum sp. ex4484_15]